MVLLVSKEALEAEETGIYEWLVVTKATARMPL
jgi:hypothetical protein